MKKVFIAIAILFSVSAIGQNYNDSLITLQLTQRAAWYVGFHIKQQSVWNDRLAPATLKNYVGSGLNQDSLFNVTVKSSWIKGMIELLVGGANEVVQADRLSIINNSPAIGGYTSLATQIVNLANGNGAQKQAAIFIRDFYLQRLADFSNVRTENKNGVISWAND